jgi:hypothetical protein
MNISFNFANKNSKMETKYNFQLISGDFNSQETLEILMSLFTSKIKFHELKNFREYELSGKENEDSKNKLELMKENIFVLQKILNRVKSKDAILKINSEVSLEILA